MSAARKISPEHCKNLGVVVKGNLEKKNTVIHILQSEAMEYLFWSNDVFFVSLFLMNILASVWLQFAGVGY